MKRLQMQAAALLEQRRQSGEVVVRAMEEWRWDPVGWAVAFMGVEEESLRWSLGEEYAEHRWDGDEDPMARLLEEVADGRDVGMESATGVGKTFALAVLSLWFLACFEGSLVVTGAPKKDQLLDQVWMEIGRLWGHFQALFPEAELLTGQIRMRPGEPDDRAWSMKAFVAGVGADEESATKAQGFHREHMLIITEETPGMHPAIMVAFNETRTDDHNIQVSVGNPDSQFDELRKFCKRQSVVALRASALDHPNVVTGRRVVPGAIGRARLEERVREMGEGTPLYLSRIRGISPPQSESSLIKWEWLEAAHDRWRAAMSEGEAGLTGALALGADVSDKEDGDPAALSRWVGSVMTEVVEVKVGESQSVRDASEFGDLVASEALDPGARVLDRHIGMDPVGVGASAVNQCRRRGVRVRELSGNSKVRAGLDVEGMWEDTSVDEDGSVKPSGDRVVRVERFRNLRAAIHWQMREDLRMGRIALPKDQELWEELTSVQWSPKGGVIEVEPKLDVRKRLGRSPNKGDAACYGNWVRSREPVEKQVQVVPEGSRNRDVGLERWLHRQEKERVRKHRTVMKAYGLRRRGGV